MTTRRQTACEGVADRRLNRASELLAPTNLCSNCSAVDIDGTISAAEVDVAFFVGSVACNARLPGGGIDEQARGTAMNSELQTGGFADRAEDSWTLPSNWYFDPVVHDLEREAIFYRTWHYQCHASDVATPGDYHVGRIADQSVFIVRDTEGALKAFYNVCSHRAHPLLEGTGKTAGRSSARTISGRMASTGLSGAREAARHSPTGFQRTPT